MRAAREEERDQFHHRLQLARDVVEEYGAPTLRARWDPNGKPLRRRRREETAEEGRRVRVRWGDESGQEEGAYDDAPREDGREGDGQLGAWRRADYEGPSGWRDAGPEGDDVEDEEDVVEGEEGDYEHGRN